MRTLRLEQDLSENEISDTSFEEINNKHQKLEKGSLC